MLDFQLFRLKVVRLTETFFNVDLAPAALIREAIVSRPERQPRRGVIWHIGNVAEVDADGIYFAFGRTARASFPQFDITDRRFIEQEFDSAPFTHVFVDPQLGVCAIARKTQLAPVTHRLAVQLGYTLTESAPAYERSVRFVVEPIRDPQEFIAQVRGALAVKKFSSTFTPPNPFDAADFQRPFERYLQAARGDRGRATIKGDDLNRGVIEEMTRSAAATGNNASARLVPPDGVPVTRHLTENTVTVAVSDIRTDEERESVMAMIRHTYYRIRGADE